MNYVLKALKPYKKWMIVAWILMIIELFVELLLPFIMGRMVDEGILPRNLQLVVFWGSILIGLSLFSFTSGIINTFFAAKVSQSFAYDIRNQAFQKIQRLSFYELNRFSTSAVVTRLTNDVHQVQITVFMILRVFFRVPLLIIFGCMMALLVNVRLALILTCIIPFSIIFLFLMMRRGIRLFTKVQSSLDKLNRIMRENLAAIRLIRAFNRGLYEVNRFTEVNKDLQRNTQLALRFVELTGPILLFVMNACIVLILWFGHFQLTIGGAGAGEVVAIINYGMRITHSLSMLSWIMMGISRAKASVDRLNEIFHLEDEKEVGQSETASLVKRATLEFNHVYFSYYSGREVLKDIHFQVKNGQTVAVLGATGSGKTTLFQLIPRLVDPDKGTLYLSGVDIRKIPRNKLRKLVGYVPQESHLFTGTIKENIAWGNRDADFSEIVQAAKDAQIHETIVSFPDGYDTVIGQKGINLSGGQKQRLTIARALVRKPKILLLDNATSALDVQTERKLLTALKRYDCTILMITQKITTARLADFILLMDEGRIIAQGTHEQLLKESDLYRQINVSQRESGVLRHEHVAK